jgi:hypothetical protein
MAENRLNAVFDWIHLMENEIAIAASSPDEDASLNSDPSTMSEEAAFHFEDTFIKGLLSGFEAEDTFKKRLQNAIDSMPPEKQQWFYEPDFAIETLCGIFERYHADFSMKVALGGSRYEAGERSLKNSGYQAGEALVGETTQWAYELIHDTICPGDDKRAVTLLAVTISCALSAMGKLTPDHEDLLCPQIMKVDPQVKFMPKEQRTPEHILERIEAVSASSWSSCKKNVFGKSHDELVEENDDSSPGYTII